MGVLFHATASAPGGGVRLSAAAAAAARGRREGEAEGVLSGRLAEEAQGGFLPGEDSIFAPNALPEFRSSGAGGRLLESAFPKRGGKGGRGGGAAAAAAAAAQGRVGAAVGGGEDLSRSNPAFKKQGWTDHFLKAHPEILSTNLRTQDPQKVLQGYAGKSAGFTGAYAATQPKTILAETTLEEELDAARAAKRAKR